MSNTSVFPQIRPHNWPGQERCSWKPIHNRLQPGPGAQTLPLVGWTFAAGPMAAFVGPAWLEKQGKSLEQVHAESLANLASQPCNHRVMDLSKPGEDKIELGVIEGDRSQSPHHIAAADHILNPNAMLALQRDLKADPMVVAIPHDGVLFAAHTSLAQRGMFLNLACQPAPPGTEPLTAIVFVIQAGQIVGKMTYG